MAKASAARARPLKLQSAKMSEVVARALLEHIIDADLEPGEPLPNERDAIAWLGVSRGSLREGLRLLEAHRVVAVRPGPGGGPVVQDLDPEAYASSSTLLMQFMRVPFGEVLDTRIVFEPQIAEVAARQRTPLQAEALQVRVGRMQKATADDEAFQESYSEFHRILAEATQNRVLLLTGVTFRKIWEPVHAEVRRVPEARHRTVLAHRHLANAVAYRDSVAASTASRQHLIEYRDYLENHQPALLARRVEWATESRRGTA